MAGPNQSKAHCNRPQDQNAHRLNIIWFTTRFYPVQSVQSAQADILDANNQGQAEAIAYTAKYRKILPQITKY